MHFSVVTVINNLNHTVQREYYHLRKPLEITNRVLLEISISPGIFPTHTGGVIKHFIYI